LKGATGIDLFEDVLSTSVVRLVSRTSFDEGDGVRRVLGESGNGGFVREFV